MKKLAENIQAQLDKKISKLIVPILLIIYNTNLMKLKTAS